MNQPAPRLPRIILLFMGVDWPLYMRRPAVVALAAAAQKRGSVVVAVNRPLCPFTTWFRKPGRVGQLFGKPRLDQIAPGLYLYSPRYLLHDQIAVRLPLVHRANLAALKKSYQHLQKRLGIGEPRPVVWFNYPEQGYVARLFPDGLSVYELYDELSDVEGRPIPQMVRREESLRPEIDLLLTTSHALEEKYGPHYRHSMFVGNGVSRQTLDRFGQHVDPLASIATIPSPRIGYAGMLSDRMDWSLIIEVARLEPGWHFVLVGPVADPAIVDRCRGESNIHFVGAIGQQAMPAVLSAFDVGLLPYRDTPFFHFLNPLKFYEMAAAGLPMVSSPIAEMRRFPQELVTVVANEANQWRQTIRTALSRDRNAVRQIGRDAVREFVWEDMAERVLDRIADCGPALVSAKRGVA